MIEFSEGRGPRDGLLNRDFVPLISFKGQADLTTISAYYLQELPLFDTLLPHLTPALALRPAAPHVPYQDQIRGYCDGDDGGGDGGYCCCYCDATSEAGDSDDADSATKPSFGDEVLQRCPDAGDVLDECALSADGHGAAVVADSRVAAAVAAGAKPVGAKYPAAGSDSDSSDADGSPAVIHSAGTVSSPSPNQCYCCRPAYCYSPPSLNTTRTNPSSGSVWCFRYGFSRASPSGRCA